MIVLVPSGALKVTFVEKTPAEQVKFPLAAPDIWIGRPSVQTPVTVKPKRVIVFSAGCEMRIVGAVVFKTKLRLAVPVFPTASVCAAKTVFVPSGLVKVTEADQVPLVQVALID